MFKNRAIEKRVMSVVRTVIDEAQKEHDEQVKQAELELEEALEMRRKAHEQRLTDILESGVKKVFSTLKTK